MGEKRSIGEKGKPKKALLLKGQKSATYVEFNETTFRVPKYYLMIFSIIA